MEGGEERKIIVRDRGRVGEVAKGFVDKRSEVAEELQSPSEAGDEEEFFVVGSGDSFDEVGGADCVGVGGEEDAGFFVVDNGFDESGEVFDVNHRAGVFNFRKDGEFEGKFAEGRVVAFAVFAINHWRTEEDNFEVFVREFLELLFGLEFAVAVKVGGSGLSFFGDDFGLADLGAVAVDDGATHVDELFDSLLFGFFSDGFGEVGVDGVIKLFGFFVNFFSVDVSDAGDVENDVVFFEVERLPSVAFDVEFVDAVFLRFAFKEVFDGDADVTVFAGDEDAFHAFTPSPLKALRKVPKKQRQSNGKLSFSMYSPSYFAFLDSEMSSRPLICAQPESPGRTSLAWTLERREMRRF